MTCLIEYCRTENFIFLVLILKYLSLKNYFVNFVEDCEIYSEEVLVNKINGIINSDKLSCSKDDLYLDLTQSVLQNTAFTSQCRRAVCTML